MTCPASQNSATSDKMIQFCTFEVSGRLYGVNILDVKEINTETCFTPIHHARREIKGYVNIRGQIYLVLDLGLLLGLEATKTAPASRVVLFKPSVGDSFGVLVDRVDDVATVPASLVENRRQNQSRQAEEGERRRDRHDLSAGICKLQDRLLVVLNAQAMLKALE